eukprot:11878939-Alexandrium_andersonii.AAC.1
MLVQLDGELNELAAAITLSVEPDGCHGLFSVAAAIGDKVQRAEQARRPKVARCRQVVGPSSPYARLLDRLVDLQA